MSQVAILGSGPAGLLAALACEQNGQEPVIFSKGDKSPMFGAMYLHEPIPGLTGDILEPDSTISVIKQGTREGYAENVYGDPNAPCSWDSIPGGDTPAWNLHKAYDKLWERYGPTIRRQTLDADSATVISRGFKLTLCSVPAPVICFRPYTHRFEKQSIWVVHGPGKALIKDVNDHDIMYYNGTTIRDGGFHWYRFSQINQYQAWEYSYPHEDHLTEEEANWGRELSEGIKPLTTTCNCFIDNPRFVRIGRFGKWTKGVLTHHAYADATEAIRALL